MEQKDSQPSLVGDGEEVSSVFEVHVRGVLLDEGWRFSVR